MTRPMRSAMLTTVLRPLLMGLAVFSAYVLVHGHGSPGGGFQAGVLCGAGLILAGLARGTRATLAGRGAMLLVVAGLLIYGGWGTASRMLGGEFLDYAALPVATSPSLRRYVGILVIESGVTLTVAGAMVSLFHTLNVRQEGA